MNPMQSPNVGPGGSHFGNREPETIQEPKPLKWGRSSGGFCESKCGRFGISPEYWGRCEPQSYTLTDRETGKEYRLLDTQKKAKERANRVLCPAPVYKPTITISDDMF